MCARQIALLISFGSALIAAISLGWNVYRDVTRLLHRAPAIKDKELSDEIKPNE